MMGIENWKYATIDGDPLRPVAPLAEPVEPLREAKTVPQARFNGDDPAAIVTLLCGSDCTPEPVRWLWNGFLARGKLHIIAGAPGTGKTTIALALAARVTSGGRWPDETSADKGNVLIWSGEDDIRDTMLPRLIAMGADRGSVFFVGDVRAQGKSRPFDPSRDMTALEIEAAKIGDVRLLIIDPVVNVVAGDSHKNSETRRSLQPVVDLAARLDAAALGISHFSKGTAGRDPVERVTGSVAFGALPRVVFAAAKSTEENATNKRVLVRSKSNIGPDGGGFGFDLEQVAVPGYPGLLASAVLWGAPLEGTAKELLADMEAEEEKTEVDEAGAWLEDELRGGPVSAKQLQISAKAAGLAWRTVHRARKRLGVASHREGFGKTATYIWQMPGGGNGSENPMRATKPHACHLSESGIHGTHGVSESLRDDRPSRQNNDREPGSDDV
jgi:putative DNA primase/helicase